MAPGTSHARKCSKNGAAGRLKSAESCGSPGSTSRLEATISALLAILSVGAQPAPTYSREKSMEEDDNCSVILFDFLNLCMRLDSYLLHSPLYS